MASEDSGLRSRQESATSLVGEGPDELMNLMFEICRTEDGKASMHLLLEELEKTGIRTADPRLSPMMRMLENLKPYTLATIDDLRLDTATFKSVLSENVLLVTKALQGQLIVPEWENFSDHFTDIYSKCKSNTRGNSAQYIQPLAEYGSDQWGAAMCTIDGQRFSIGDASEPFTVQATGSPVTYAICLNELGEDVVHKYQGRHPSGRTYNEIVLDHHNRPHNPLVASGCIMSAALLLELVKRDEWGDEMAAKFDYVFEYFRNLCGGEHLTFNNSVFLAERESSDRNFAIAHFMRENGCFPPGTDIKKVLEFYIQLCSLEMTCESLSVLAGTLANGGVCPITGERVLSAEVVVNVRALMYSCGMYNYSGQFAFEVGLPAKSGISGALMVVIPNVMGVALWSPPLDSLGNSYRGTLFCRLLTQKYNFHRFDAIGINQKQYRKIDPTFKKGETASEIVIQLLLAAAAGDIRALQRFWLQDVDLNVMDYDGRTVLHLAAAEGHYDTVKFLTETVKVRLSPKDRWGRTPLIESIAFGHSKVATYLNSYIEENPDQGYEESESESDSEEDDEDTDELLFVVEEDEENKYDGDDNDEIENASDASPMLPIIVTDIDDAENGSTSPSLGSSQNLTASTARAESVNSPVQQGQRSRRGSAAFAALLDPSDYPFGHHRSRSGSNSASPFIRVNTRSPKITPRESPTLPRAHFSPRSFQDN